MKDWTPVTGPLPDDDTLVLAAFGDGEVWPCFRDGDIWRYVTAEPVESVQVTHWMHMPPAPGRSAA